MRMGQINICSHSLQMAARACHGNETLAHAGEGMRKYLSVERLTISSDGAVTFAFRGQWIDKHWLPQERLNQTFH